MITIRKFRIGLLLLSSYYSILFYGTYFALLGYMLPQIKAEFHVNYTQSGLIFLLPILPGILGNIFAGYIFGRVHKRLILIISSAIIVLFYLLMPFAPNYTVFLTLNFLLCAGISLMHTAVSVSISDVLSYGLPKYKDNGILLQHFLFTLGSIIALVAGAWLVHRDFSWRSIFFLDAAAAIPFLLLFIVSKYPETLSHKKEDAQLKLSSYIKLMRNPALLAYSVAIMLYVGAENGIVNWAACFLENGHGYTKSTTTIALTLFFVMLTLGRLIGAFIIHKLNQRMTVAVLTAASAIVIVLEVLFQKAVYGVDLYIPLTGFLFAVIFPTIQNQMMKDFQDNLSSATGVFFAFSSIGATLLPFMIGVGNDLTGVKYGMIAASLYLIILIPVFLGTRRKLTLQ